MTAISEKVAYVRAAGQTRDHHCHWPGCTRQVPPASWGCREHWFTLPKEIRDRIWNAYRVGQEASQTPYRAYVAAAREAQEWIAWFERKNRRVHATAAFNAVIARMTTIGIGGVIVEECRAIATAMRRKNVHWRDITYSCAPVGRDGLHVITAEGVASAKEIPSRPGRDGNTQAPKGETPRD